MVRLTTLLTTAKNARFGPSHRVFFLTALQMHAGNRAGDLLLGDEVKGTRRFLAESLVSRLDELSTLKGLAPVISEVLYAEQSGSPLVGDVVREHVVNAVVSVCQDPLAREDSYQLISMFHTLISLRCYTAAQAIFPAVSDSILAGTPTVRKLPKATSSFLKKDQRPQSRNIDRELSRLTKRQHRFLFDAIHLEFVTGLRLVFRRKDLALSILGGAEGLEKKNIKLFEGLGLAYMGSADKDFAAKVLSRIRPSEADEPIDHRVAIVFGQVIARLSPILVGDIFTSMAPYFTRALKAQSADGFTLPDSSTTPGRARPFVKGIRGVYIRPMDLLTSIGRCIEFIRPSPTTRELLETLIDHVLMTSKQSGSGGVQPATPPSRDGGLGMSTLRILEYFPKFGLTASPQQWETVGELMARSSTVQSRGGTTSRKVYHANYVEFRKLLYSVEAGVQQGKLNRENARALLENYTTCITIDDNRVWAAFQLLKALRKPIASRLISDQCMSSVALSMEEVLLHEAANAPPPPPPSASTSKQPASKLESKEGSRPPSVPREQMDAKEFKALVLRARLLFLTVLGCFNHSFKSTGRKLVRTLPGVRNERKFQSSRRGGGGDSSTPDVKGYVPKLEIPVGTISEVALSLQRMGLLSEELTIQLTAALKAELAKARNLFDEIDLKKTNPSADSVLLEHEGDEEAGMDDAAAGAITTTTSNVSQQQPEVDGSCVHVSPDEPSSDVVDESIFDSLDEPETVDETAPVAVKAEESAGTATIATSGEKMETPSSSNVASAGGSRGTVATAEEEDHLGGTGAIMWGTEGMYPQELIPVDQMTEEQLSDLRAFMNTGRHMFEDFTRLVEVLPLSTRDAREHQVITTKWFAFRMGQILRLYFEQLALQSQKDNSPIAAMTRPQPIKWIRVYLALSRFKLHRAVRYTVIQLRPVLLCLHLWEQRLCIDEVAAKQARRHAQTEWRMKKGSLHHQSNADDDSGMDGEDDTHSATPNQDVVMSIEKGLDVAKQLHHGALTLLTRKSEGKESFRHTDTTKFSMPLARLSTRVALKVHEALCSEVNRSAIGDAAALLRYHRQLNDLIERLSILIAEDWNLTNMSSGAAGTKPSSQQQGVASSLAFDNAVKLTKIFISNISDERDETQVKNEVDAKSPSSCSSGAASNALKKRMVIRTRALVRLSGLAMRLPDPDLQVAIYRLVSDTQWQPHQPAVVPASSSSSSSESASQLPSSCPGSKAISMTSRELHHLLKHISLAYDSEQTRVQHRDDFNAAQAMAENPLLHLANVDEL